MREDSCIPNNRDGAGRTLQAPPHDLGLLRDGALCPLPTTTARRPPELVTRAEVQWALGTWYFSSSVGGEGVTQGTGTSDALGLPSASSARLRERVPQPGALTRAWRSDGRVAPMKPPWVWGQPLSGPSCAGQLGQSPPPPRRSRHGPGCHGHTGMKNESLSSCGGSSLSRSHKLTSPRHRLLRPGAEPMCAGLQSSVLTEVAWGPVINALTTSREPLTL